MSGYWIPFWEKWYLKEIKYSKTKKRYDWSSNYSRRLKIRIIEKITRIIPDIKNETTLKIKKIKNLSLKHSEMCVRRR
jgi:hypothetical protein